MRPERGGIGGRTRGDAKRKPCLVVTLDSSPLSVRAALVELRSGLSHLSLEPDAGGAIELVLAEVLNNICEHAYQNAPGGRIELSVWVEGEMLVFQTADHGAPMPCGRLPEGRSVSLNRHLQELPEGGFGWNLIRQLAADLTYCRAEGRNRLTFRMRLDAQPIDAV